MAESHQMAEGKMIRYWIFLKNHPEEIIGTICFHNILSIPYQSSFLGYKISGKYEHLGYAFESIQKAIEVIYETNHIHRIEAYIMPNNSLSLRLIKKLGFHYEGLCISYAHINGRWEDHERYALINPQDIVGHP
jgi:ribosomal-protein-alanine N-acetyltransferase